ncbi:MAG: discoidin domain-containing protein [Bacteroidota bacterium]
MTLKRMILQISILFSALQYGISSDSVKCIDYNRIFYHAEKKYGSMIGHNGDYSIYPRSINADGTVSYVSAADWTSGFFPGSLWYLYENTRNEYFENNAQRWTSGISSQKFNTGTHDLGFMFYCSFGNGLRLSDPEGYSSILLSAANSLMTRYDPEVGCLRSWDFGSWEFPVIIDNMMNLELLFWATKQTGDSAYYNVALTHAETTMQNHFREDYSSWHVVDYNKTTGAVISKTTFQGYADDSHWARGQAWGLYGYVMTYRETGNALFLEQAEHLADFFMEHPHLPSDLVPYWDFLAPGIPDEPRDASAAAIVASALLELSEYSNDSTLYFSMAEEIISNLSKQEYLSSLYSDNDFLLLKATGHKPANREISTSVNWADYYFLEALTRYRNISGKNFAPYISAPDHMLVSSGVGTIDTVRIYDLDSQNSFELQVTGLPDFITVEELSDTEFSFTFMPSTDDVGQYIFQLETTDGDGNGVIKEVLCTVEENAFADISVAASHSSQGHFPEHTLDRNLNTYWESNEYGSHLTYDLGGTFVIDTVKIAFTNGEQNKYQVTIQSSLDGTEWRPESFVESNGETRGFEFFTLPNPKSSRYIRLIGYGNDNDKLNRYAEVRFMITDPAVSSPYFVENLKDIKVLQGSDMLIVDGCGREKFLMVEIFNIRGTLVMKSRHHSTEFPVIIPIGSLEEEIYILKVCTESRVFLHRFIRSR